VCFVATPFVKNNFIFDWHVRVRLYIYVLQTLHEIYTQNYESLEFEPDKSVQHNNIHMSVELNFTYILTIF
jgi:hypothetical protein